MNTKMPCIAKHRRLYKSVRLQVNINKRRLCRSEIVKKKRAMIDLSLKDTIDLINKLLMPIVNAIINNEKFNKKWNCQSLCWK